MGVVPVLQPSATLQALLRISHELVIHIEILNGGQPVLEITGGDGIFTGGEVRVDGTAAVHRTLTCDIVDDDGTKLPRTAADLLHPQSGSEFRVYRGARPHGSTADAEVVQVGVYVPTTLDVHHTRGDLTLTLTASDRSLLISENGWTAIYRVARNSNPITVAQAMIVDRLPGAEVIVAAATTFQTPQMIFGQDGAGDPWADIRSVVESAGLEVFPDRAGRFVIRPVPDVSTAPVAAVYTTGDVGVLSDVGRSIVRQGGYKKVIVKGTGVTGRPLTASAGPGGGRTFTIRTDKAKTAGQLQAMADALYLRKKEPGDVVDYTGLVDPAREAGDVVRVTDDDTGVDTTMTLDAFNVPLTADGKQQGSTRERDER